MKIPVRELAVGDILRLNDWQLHVIAVEHDVATAVLTSEFAFLLHFTRDETVDIVGNVCHSPQRHDARDRPTGNAGAGAAVTTAELIAETESDATSATTDRHRADSGNRRSCGTRSRGAGDRRAVAVAAGCAAGPGVRGRER